MRGADILASAMAQAGVEVVFSLSGNQIMPLYDALIDPGIRIVHSRHEAAAVFMAEAYAQLSGRIGVALVTAAPGFANALGALYTARMSESPVVFLSGDSPISQDGQGAFQEFPQEAAAAPFVKYTERINSAEEIPEAFARAVRLANSGVPGPVHLALPVDMLNADVEPPDLLPDGAFFSLPLYPEIETIDRVLDRLAGYDRPLILTGPQVSGARMGEAADRLAAALDVPVVTLESPRGLKDPALGAFAWVLAEADCLFYIGKAVDFMSGFAGKSLSSSCDIMFLHPDAHKMDLGPRLVFSAHAEARPAFETLTAAGKGGTKRAGWRRAVSEALDSRVEALGNGGILAAEVGAAVQAILDRNPETVLICDGGEFGQWIQATTRTATRIINGPSGAIGAALPYAIGAKLARPETPVIALMGDGTAGFHLAEFETAARERTAFVAIVGNDARWNAEQVLQIRDYGPERKIGCDLSPDARYDRAAAALGCQGFHVSEGAQLAEVLAKAMVCGGPACIDVAIEALAAPMVTGQAPQSLKDSA